MLTNENFILILFVGEPLFIAIKNEKLRSHYIGPHSQSFYHILSNQSFHNRNKSNLPQSTLREHENVYNINPNKFIENQ